MVNELKEKFIRGYGINEWNWVSSHYRDAKNRKHQLEIFSEMYPGFGYKNIKQMLMLEYPEWSLKAPKRVYIKRK